MELIIGILITCGVVYAIVSWLSKESKSMSSRNFSSVLEKIDNFTPSKTYLNGKGDTGIAIDEDRGKLCLVYGIANIGNPIVDESDPEGEIYNFEDILEAHITEDEIVRTDAPEAGRNTRTGNGGVKANSTAQKVKTVELKIIINDEKKNGHSIKFMDVDRPVEKNNTIYKNAIENAIYWQSLINGFITKDNKDYDQKEQEDKKTSNNSVADEIIKLAQLLEQGYITQEEFDSQKAKLLR